MTGPPPASGITERVIIPVKGGVDDWKEPLKQLLLTLKATPGVIRHRWGPVSEDPNILELMVGWTTEDARAAFEASPAHDKAMQAMSQVLAGPPQAYGVKFVPYAPKDAIDSPFVELVTVTGLDGEDEHRLRSHFETVKALDGCNGCACGFSTSEVDGGRVWVAAAGWSSLEKSREADKTVYLPGGGGGKAQVQTHHVNYNFPIKGFSATNSVH